MAVEIRTVQSKKDLRTFVNFPEKLYKNNPYYVPYLEFDQMDTLDQKKGAAQEFCEAGIKWAETNAILEDNKKNQGQFKDFELECRKRRRSFCKKLEY